ncbi:MAG TPA: hypothetical protein VL625_03670 [Patescibacteria group bacterium]|nr:hypothetical protein [Patescibacteria group bacterium]
MTTSEDSNAPPARAPLFSAAQLPRYARQFLVRLRQLWRGKVPLLQTFWLYYFTVILALKLLGGTHGARGDFFGLLTLFWAGFMVKPIISAADNYRGDQIWAALAKILALIIAVCVLSDLMASF